MQQVFMIMTLPRFLSQQSMNSSLSLTLVLTLIDSLNLIEVNFDVLNLPF